ncbi:glycoside hydrolase superfamily [Pilobolus umbonatus]|nr:glycoside hydrolase superfamily [Pilobolus umbonatus]
MLISFIDIKYCQQKNKKVLLSMGGATPAYGLATAEEGIKLADELWNLFCGGTSVQRPFGSASVDGFDLDIENGAKEGYTAFALRMHENYKKDPSKKYYLAAAPQCPFPDFYVGEVLNNAWFDFVMIQFYNNYCSVINTEQFNYGVWDNWAKTVSINKEVRLFVGIPGSPSAAGRGYVPFSQLVTAIQPLQSMNSFGGIMVWDVSQAYGNTMDVLPHYASGITQLIYG